MPIDWDWCMFTMEVWKLYVKENLYDCNGIRTHSDLVHKQILSHLVKLTKWFSGVVSSCLCGGTFDCVFLSCHKRVLEWIYTL